MIDTSFVPGWIGFAHSFAFQGEHDQAIAAYVTSTRLFKGNSIPLLYIGMQHLLLHNVQIAYDIFKQSYLLKPDDPFLLNELGVVCFHNNEYVNIYN